MILMLGDIVKENVRSIVLLNKMPNTFRDDDIRIINTEDDTSGDGVADGDIGRKIKSQHYCTATLSRGVTYN